MKYSEGTYDSHLSKNISLENITKLFSDFGISNIYVKKLAPNDNSKNQPYFGAHLTDLPFIPTGDLVTSDTTSKKTSDKKRQIKYQASLDLVWINADGAFYPASNAKLIYYPQYPEVRFSGFLKGSEVKLSEWMSPQKQGRSHGRWLMMGVGPDKRVYTYLVTPECSLSKELENTNLVEVTSVFGQVDNSKTGVTNTRIALLEKLLEINDMGWISGQRLKSDGAPISYKAANGGGYTLESLLRIIPNGTSEPDYLGWEVKQFGVKRFPRIGAKPTTLMTPEPNGGYYRLHGASDFVRAFGYPDRKGVPDRMNFGGRHLAGKECSATNLTMNIEGFDFVNSLITDAKGAITLTDEKNVVAASWGFSKIMDHWKRKHSQAVYVPCVMRASQSGGREYSYGSNVELGIGTTFEMFLSAIIEGKVYYDPGIKLENASSKNSKIKARSQFRVNHSNISSLYKALEFIDLQGE